MSRRNGCQSYLNDFNASTEGILQCGEFCIVCKDIRCGEHPNKFNVDSVEQIGDPVIDGIYNRFDENDSEPEVGTFITFGTLKLFVRQEWIDLKNDILTESPDDHHKTIFLRGTSGRGKTSFVYYLMYCILISAKRSKKRKADHESEPLVGYLRNHPLHGILSYVLTLRCCRNVASIPNSVSYYIADTKEDVNKTNLAQCFTMAVASDDAGKDEFLKRVDEADADNDSGYTYTMPSPTREEMHSIFKSILTPDEIDFRLDVVGCNPRVLGRKFGKFKPYPQFETLVEDTCAEVLGCSKTDADPSHFNWVKCTVMKSIIRSITSKESNANMSSLFREDVTVGYELISVCTSTFMCFLAGKIRDQFTADTLGYLTKIFGRCGGGNCQCSSR